MFVFLDTETTGTEEDDRLCQIAYKIDGGKIVNEFFNPQKKIDINAMCVHHITNEMVAKKPIFRGSHIEKKLFVLLDDPENCLVAHNAKFDVDMIKKEGISPKNVICTLRLARHLDPKGEIPKYNLQYLRYYLGIKVEATAHDALGDILVLKNIFYRLYRKFFFENFSDMDKKESIEKSIKNSTEKKVSKPDLYRQFFQKAETNENVASIRKQIIELSQKPSLLPRIFFGKHKGELFKDIPKDYLEWLSGQNDLDEDLEYTIKHYLGSNN